MHTKETKEISTCHSCLWAAPQPQTLGVPLPLLSEYFNTNIWAAHCWSFQESSFDAGPFFKDFSG